MYKIPQMKDESWHLNLQMRPICLVRGCRLCKETWPRNVTMLWEALWHWKLETKIRRLGLVFFPKICALVQLAFVTGLGTAVKQSNCIITVIFFGYGNLWKQTKHKQCSEADFVKKQRFQGIHPIINLTSCIAHPLALLSVCPRAGAQHPFWLQPSTHSHLNRRASGTKAPD